MSPTCFVSVFWFPQNPLSLSSPRVLEMEALVTPDITTGDRLWEEEPVKQVSSFLTKHRNIQIWYKPSINYPVGKRVDKWSGDVGYGEPVMYTNCFYFQSAVKYMNNITSDRSTLVRVELLNNFHFHSLQIVCPIGFLVETNPIMSNTMLYSSGSQTFYSPVPLQTFNLQLRTPSPRWEKKSFPFHLLL